MYLTYIQTYIYIYYYTTCLIHCFLQMKLEDSNHWHWCGLSEVNLWIDGEWKYNCDTHDPLLVPHFLKTLTYLEDVWRSWTIFDWCDVDIREIMWLHAGLWQGWSSRSKCRNGLLDRIEMIWHAAMHAGCLRMAEEDAKYSKMVTEYGPLNVFRPNC